MKQILSIIILVIFLTGCTTTTNNKLYIDKYNIAGVQHASKDVKNHPELDGPAMTVAVYQFTDKTGQRKPGLNIAHLSSAVTQGADAYLIETLKEVGNGTWFQVVERAGIDHLIKERQIIRQTRELNEDKEKLRPLLFAGVLIEGAIVGYDSNLETGGNGARILGIGANSQYTRDSVTISIRLVSVSSGEILLTSTTTKTIIGAKTQGDIFRWFDAGTLPVEGEVGVALNEPVNVAVRLAIELAVCDLIERGNKKKLWAFKSNDGLDLQTEVEETISDQEADAKAEEEKAWAEVDKEVEKQQNINDGNDIHSSHFNLEENKL